MLGPSLASAPRTALRPACLPRPLRFRCPNQPSAQPFSTAARPQTRSRSAAMAVIAAASAGLAGAAAFAFNKQSLSPLACEAQPPALSSQTFASSSSSSSRPSFVPEPTIDLDDASIPMRHRMIHHIKSLQSTICTALESLEPAGSDARFHSSYYLRDANKGFGDSRVLQDGTTFEKAGCNISVIQSTLSPAAVRQMRAERFDWWDGESELPYFVAGCSLVVHPRNPHAPTVHFNYRYFEIQDPRDPTGPPKAWWFGGGTDLTPSYLYDEDARAFHGTYKQACDRHDPTYYARFKKWCDEYFYIPHRHETRGLGGIFFDDLSSTSAGGAGKAGDAVADAERIFRFVRDCSNSYLPAYYPLVEKRKDQPYSDREKRWQQLRRGRYVEFNLVYDRGTKFGLAMKEPRTESILMSLPLTSRWEYEPDLGTEPGSAEKRLLDILRKPVEWA